MKWYHEQNVRLLLNTFLHLQGKAAKQIHMLGIYNYVCPLYNTVKHWKSHFETGQNIVQN